MFNEILDLTKKLVSISSVNGSIGEKNIGCFIEKYFKDIPYFKTHSSRVIVQKLKNDPLERQNVIVLLKGEKEESNKTIIFHGHTDTVGVEDFGNLSEYAFDCDKLMKKLKEITLPEEVEKDLMSGDYLFGRGACDMKSGDAVFMVLIKHLSEKVKELKGNIIAMFNPVEENLHTGIIEAREILEQLQEKFNLKYELAINNDYICPLYPNDTTRHVYTGSVGKILPCFYIQGKETHVGQCFEGFDASLTASELVKLVNLNTDFCEAYNGEYTLPPSALKMKDLKNEYNVQTSFNSFVYFNYFIHNASINEIMKKLYDVSFRALNNTEKIINDRYKDYCRLSNMEYSKINYEKQVLSYNELFKKAEEKCGYNLSKLIEEMTDRLIKENVDKREIPMNIVRKLCKIAQINIPTIVIFFAAPYCPHNTLKKEDKKEKQLFIDIENILDEFGKESNEKYQLHQFFPSLTDSSYLKIDDDEESINLLINNFPSYEKLYNVPLDKIKKLNISAINYGCFGKDAHKWTERVYMPYSFNVLPRLILKTINYFFDEKEN
mgnify:CR=1 FL=1|jgi:arginine utilization protein RocB